MLLLLFFFSCLQHKKIPLERPQGRILSWSRRGKRGRREGGTKLGQRGKGGGEKECKNKNNPNFPPIFFPLALCQGHQDGNQQPAPPEKVGWVRKFCGKGIFREIWKNRYVVLKGDQLYISEKEVGPVSVSFPIPLFPPFCI